MSATKEMRQWVTDQNSLDNVKQETAQVPEPGPDEVLVKVHTVSLNYRDTEVCTGTYGHHRSISQGSLLVPCSDMAGTIASVGKNVSSWSKGQRVASIFNQTHQKGQIREKDMASGLGLPLPGVLTEYRVFPADGLVAVPDYLTDEEMSCLPIAAVTAWTSINWMQPMGKPILDSNTTVLFQGTGGVAINGLQIAKACGLKAIVTSSSDEKLEKARKLGADHTINYKSTSNWDEKVMEITNGEGVDIILETGGAETLQKSFECVTFGGMISCIGYLSGKEDSADKRPNVNVMALKRNVTLKGILNGPKDRFEEMLEIYKAKQIRPVIDRVFDFDQAKDALKYLASGAHFGKVVIKLA